MEKNIITKNLFSDLNNVNLTEVQLKKIELPLLIPNKTDLYLQRWMSRI